MDLAKFLIIGSCIGLVGCASSQTGKRGIASEPGIPEVCKLQISNVIQSPNSRGTIDGTLLSAKASCKNGLPHFTMTHPNGRTIKFSVPTTGKPGEATAELRNGLQVVTDTQSVKTPAARNAAEERFKRLVFNNFSIDYVIDETGLMGLRQACQFLNKPLTIAGTPAVGDVCPLNHLGGSPVASFSHNGKALNPHIMYTCNGTEPRYSLSLEANGVVEQLEVGASDGSYKSDVAFRRIQYRSSGGPVTSSVKGVHQKNNFVDNRLTIQARGQNFVVDFNPEMLMKHKQWCNISAQNVETLPTPAVSAEAPAAEGAVTDPVILQ